LRREAALLLLDLRRMALWEVIGVGTCGAAVTTSVPSCIWRRRSLLRPARRPPSPGGSAAFACFLVATAAV